MNSPILVTSKRTIGNCPRAMAWACGIIAGVYRAINAHAIVTGDAAGGDHAARLVSVELDTHIAVYCAQSGLVSFYKGEHEIRTRKWCAAVSVWSPKERPIHRNEAMITEFAPRNPKVVALLDARPADRITHGTERTIALAEAAKLEVLQFTWRG